MKLTAIVAALIACSASVEAAEIFILGDSTTSHYEYSPKWTVNPVAGSIAERGNNEILQNQIFGWGMFAKQYVTAGYNVWNLARGGISARSWWSQFGTSSCNWPAIKNVVCDPLTGCAGANVELYSHHYYQSQGVINSCPTAYPSADDYVIIQLGINEALYNLTNSATVISKVKGDTAYRITPDEVSQTGQIKLNHAWTNPSVYVETVDYFSTYIKKLISSVVCQQSSKFGAVGTSTFSSTYTPQNLYDDVVLYNSSSCIKTKVKVILANDNFRPNQWWGSSLWPTQLKAIIADFNGYESNTLYRIPPLLDAFNEQKKIYGAPNYDVVPLVKNPSWTLGVSPYTTLDAAGMADYFYAYAFKGFTMGRDGTHPNYFGGRVNAIAIMCALANRGYAFVDTAKLPAGVCTTLGTGAVATATTMSTVLSHIGVAAPTTKVSPITLPWGNGTDNLLFSSQSFYFSPAQMTASLLPTFGPL